MTPNQPIERKKKSIERGRERERTEVERERERRGSEPKEKEACFFHLPRGKGKMK